MNNNILSSIALFSELYKNNNDVFHIIAQFIKASINIECQYTFTDTDMLNMLERNFNITIPQPLVSYILRNKLKEEIKRSTGQYVVNDPSSLNGRQFSEQQRNLQNDYENIFIGLYTYIETIKAHRLEDSEKGKIKTDFINYLLKQGSSDYLDLFSAFIVSNQYQKNFTEKLNLVTEGLVVYSGIQYKSPEDINQLGNWKNSLTIYLDTEQLFNLAGYNDEYYKKTFDDFYNLVTEVNRKSGRKIIFLKYFEEIQIEVEKYFLIAERIVLGKDQLIPGRLAMINILNGCRDEFDVKTQKSRFFKLLQDYGVNLDSETTSKDIWNIGSQEVLQNIEKDLKTKKINYNEDEAVRYLSIFSKINSLRNGSNKAPVEKCGYIFLSANSFVRYLSCFEDVKQDRSTPFATDIDYVTSKIWFVLQKSFTKETTPISFDIIARSQLVLKSHYDNTIHERYEELIAKDMPTEAKIDIYKDLHCKGTLSAKDINYDSLPSIISFIEMPNIDALLEEKSIHKAKLEEAEKIKSQFNVEKDAKQDAERKASIFEQENLRLAEENKKKDRINRGLLYAPIKKRIRQRVCWQFIGIYTIIVVIVGILLLVIYWLKHDNDTTLAVIGVLLSIIFFILPFIKGFRRLISSNFRSVSVKRYKDILKK